MSDESFTPGPWRLTPYFKVLQDGAALAQKPSPNRWQAIVEPVPGSEYGSRSLVVGVGIKGQVDDYWLSIKEANARLISKSPDLYEALKASTAWLIDERDSKAGEKCLDRLDELIDRNRALLKAVLEGDDGN